MKKNVCCNDCGLLYGGDSWIEAIIPDKIWIKISPTGNLGGILCISCIANRLTKMKLYDVPVWMCGTEPLRAISGDPVDNIKLLRT